MKEPHVLCRLLAGGALCAALSSLAWAGNATAPQGPTRPTASGGDASAGYQIGLLLGNQLEHQGLQGKLKIEDVVRGLKDGFAGHAQTPQERDASLHLIRDSHEALATSNRNAAHDFLTRNAQQPGIRTTPSGLQYRVLAEGDAAGKSPALLDEVTVRYRASLPDGRVFDRSEAHDSAATFRVNGVLKGWQEALLAMKPGTKWQLFVPPELSYGSNTPPDVPPGSLVIYELELVSVGAPPPVDLTKRAPTH